MATKKLEIVELRAHNFLGLQRLEVKLGKLNRVTGRNGAGKSAVLKVVRAALGGSQKAPGLVHQGEDEGEVYLKLSDGVQVRRRITPEGAREAEVLDAQFGQPMKKPEGYLKKLFDALSLDPTEFLVAQDKERIRLLLQAFPVHATAEAVAERVGGAAVVSKQPHSLADLATLETLLREKRTLANGARTETRKTVEGLQRLSKPEDLSDIEASLADMTAARDKILAGQAEHKGEIDAAYNDCKKAIDREEQRELDEVRAKYRSQREAAATAHTESLARAAEMCADTLAKLNARMGELNEKLKIVERDREAARIAEELSAKLVKQEADWLTLENAVRGIEELREYLARDLPITGLRVTPEGLEAQDDEGRWVMFDSLNTAAQIKIAVRLAVHGSGELRAVLADGLERLDDDAREVFLDECARQDAQFIVAYARSGEDLHVEAEGGAQ